MNSYSQPQRSFLADQVAEILRRELSTNRWKDRLPAERSLARAMNVSRPTLRAALHRLLAANELAVLPRNGYIIRRAGQRRAKPPKRQRSEIGLICPQQIYSMPPHVIQVVDVLRGLCAEAGLPVELFEGPRFSRTRPGLVMPRLVRSRPNACWVAIMAGRRLQEWLAKSDAPVVLYGNRYADLRIPSVGIDYRACVRHATAQLLARGHRHIVFVNFDPERAGDQESMSGFFEAFAAFKSNSGAGGLLGGRNSPEPVVISRPDDDIAALRRQLDRLVAMRPGPTAFIVSRTHHYATVATHLMRKGLMIPRDVSLISRGDDPFLHFLSPAPAHYRVNIDLLGRRLFRCVQQMTAGAEAPCDRLEVVPDYIAGETIGPVSNRTPET
ncbi:MAG: substrate-binding domain-containing protein [Opitutaceae bacterium]|nr:substrate-binding domain-containing protein [Opitutaceae bacterium]